MLHDPWLGRWLPLIDKAASGRPVLEIGCGTGDDTSTLVTAGFTVVAFDISAASVATTRVRVPEAQLSCQDVRAPLPLGDGEAGAVVASLTLHYFPWSETLELVRRVRRTLAPGGIFLCRLNSTEDRHFGATGHPSSSPTTFSSTVNPRGSSTGRRGRVVRQRLGRAVDGTPDDEEVRPLQSPLGIVAQKAAESSPGGS